jgi:hypothetical protein
MNKKDNITILKDLYMQIIFITIFIPLLYFFQLFTLNFSIIYVLSIFYLSIPIISIILTIIENKENLILKQEFKSILIKLLFFQISLIISVVVMQKLQENGDRVDDQLAERMIAIIVVFFIPIITWIIYLKHIINNYKSLNPSKK